MIVTHKTGKSQQLLSVTSSSNSLSPSNAPHMLHRGNTKETPTPSCRALAMVPITSLMSCLAPERKGPIWMHLQAKEEKQKQPLAFVPQRREGKPPPKFQHQTCRHAASPVAPGWEVPGGAGAAPVALQGGGGAVTGLPSTCSPPGAAHRDAETKLGKPPPRPWGSFPRALARELIARHFPPVPSLSLPSLPISFQFIYFSDLNPHLVV